MRATTAAMALPSMAPNDVDEDWDADGDWADTVVVVDVAVVGLVVVVATETGGDVQQPNDHFFFSFESGGC